MTPIQVQISLPDGSTRRQVFSDPEVTFGREADNKLILAHQVASRHHGVIKFADDQWVLENLSDNGTRVNGSRVGRRGVALETGDVVQIGDHEVFRVKIDVKPDAPEAPAPPPSEAAVAASAAKKKARLYLGLGIYVLVSLFVFLFVVLPYMNSQGATATQKVPRLTRSAITDALRARPAELPARLDPDPRLAHDNLEDATNRYNRLDARPDAVYLAYHAYQLSLAYSGKSSFDVGLDQIRFNDLEKRLIDEVSRRYDQGYNQFMSHDLSGAEITFQKLEQYYPDVHSPVYGNIQELLQAIAKQKSSGHHGLSF